MSQGRRDCQVGAHRPKRQPLHVVAGPARSLTRDITAPLGFPVKISFSERSRGVVGVLFQLSQLNKDYSTGGGRRLASASCRSAARTSTTWQRICPATSMGLVVHGVDGQAHVHARADACHPRPVVSRVLLNLRHQRMIDGTRQGNNHCVMWTTVSASHGPRPSRHAVTGACCSRRGRRGHRQRPAPVGNAAGRSARDLVRASTARTAPPPTDEAHSGIAQSGCSTVRTRSRRRALPDVWTGARGDQGDRRAA